MNHASVQVEHLLLGLILADDAILGPVFAEFGLSIQPARAVVRERLGMLPASSFGGQLSFSPAAQAALSSANRFGMGNAAPAHILVVLLRGGQGGPSEILRTMSVDPNKLRAEAKKRAWPIGDAEPRPQVRGVVGPVLDELDFDE